MLALKSSDLYDAQVDYQDFVQCGTIGLLKAMLAYDVNHPSQASFNTYAYY